MGGAAYGAAGANGSGGQPVGGGSRQPVDQIGGKRGSNDNQVGYDGGKQVKGRKIHALVDSEGLPCGSSFIPPRSRTATGPVWCSTRYGASHGSN
jgi:hypothetical protein